MSDLRITKENIRNFLVFCVDIANAKNDRKKISDLIIYAVEQGIIERAVLDFRDSAYKLINAVEETACFLNEVFHCHNIDPKFWVCIDRFKQYYSSTPYISEYPEGKGTVRLYMDTGFDDLIKEEQYLAVSLDIDELVLAFFSCLQNYAIQRNIQISKVPLRLCKHCGKIFFGNKYDQAFCTVVHGRRWRAMNSYKTKKDIKN